MGIDIVKPFWLVFRGHFLFDWDDTGVTVHVPVLEVPHGHDYKVSTSGAPTYVAVEGGNHAVTGMLSDKPMSEPDEKQHLRQTKAVSLSKPQNGLARIRLAQKPTAIHVLAGRTASAAVFRNGMDPSTVLSPEDAAGNYRMCDLAVWQYSAETPPVFLNGKVPVKAFAVDGGYAMVFTADPRPAAGHGGHTGHTGHAMQAGTTGRKGINDILTVNQQATTYRFAEPITGETIFVDYKPFDWVEGMFLTPTPQNGIPMGSCDQDSTGPRG